jgi:hypothetical protein
LSQENTTFNRYYIKLSPSLNFESPKEVLNINALQSLKQQYAFKIFDAYGFSKEKIEGFSKQSKSNFTLKNTFRIEATLNTEASNNLLTALKKLPNLVYAYQSNTQPIAPPHDIAPATDNLETNQGYIESNPGLNVRYAWNNGAFGDNIKIRAVEYGLNINHEELDHQNVTIAVGATINAGASTEYTEHGTSVAGVVIGDKGSYGISGLAYNATEYVLYPEWTEEYQYNRVTATANAIANSTEGDILIFETQAYAQNDKFAPGEYEQAIWDLTKIATDAGIIVVAAAGNGDENLDDTFYNDYNARGDSGAIIVGAGTSDLNHNKMGFSSYGSRVNVHSWGQNVFTTGEGYSPLIFGNDFNQYYNPYFSGTSSATATMGGFLAVLQSYYLAQTGNYLSPSAMRSLIVNTGIPQGTGGNIGPLPNMEAAILELNNLLNVDSFNVSNFVMYPNPTKEMLNINLSKNKNTANLKIHNVLGQQVYAAHLTQTKSSIPVTHLSKGLYLVTIVTEHSKHTKKLIIN